MQRIYVSDTINKVGEEVKLSGWINTIRDHGKVFFFELRDKSGLVQVVGDDSFSSLRDEDVVELIGTVNKRPENMVNPNLSTGEIEIQAKSFQVLSKSKEIPFPLSESGLTINEELRLKYRYLDLRRQRLSENIKLRSHFIQACRQVLFEEGFYEIETPILTKSTKEGARDFIVPSRFQPGKFYALPQSPQQYKQLLMTAGFEKYFQVARCIRDEDLRADRGFEFTQLDLEMSFVERNDVMALVEKVVKAAVKAVGKTLKNESFPIINYDEAISKYKADKFDLRNEEEKKAGVLAFAWVVNFPFFKKVDKEDITEVRDGKSGWTFTHNPFSQPNPENLTDHLSGINIESIKTQQYDLVCNGFEAGGGSIRANDPNVLRKTFEIMGYSNEEIEKSIGHMLEAFSFGTPPHGGIALGLDRLIMLLAGENSVKEAIAFPMSSTGRTAIMDAPSEVSEEQMKELGIETRSTQNISALKLDCFSKICAFLNQEKTPYQTFFHEPALTSEQSAEVRGTSLEEGAKALIVNADNQKMMFVVSAVSKLDLNSLKKLFNVKDLSLISLEELEKITGLKPGAIPPFGSLFGLKTYIDENLANMEMISFNAGANDKSIRMKAKDFVLAEKPEIGIFAK